MTAPKTFGQIAFEASFDFAASAEVWTNQGEGNQAHWERIASAVAAAQQQRIAAWLLEQPDMCTTDSQAALYQAAQMLMHGEIV